MVTVMDASPMLAALPLKADLTSTASANRNARIKVGKRGCLLGVWVAWLVCSESSPQKQLCVMVVHSFNPPPCRPTDDAVAPLVCAYPAHTTTIPTQVFVKGSDGYNVSLAFLFTAANPGGCAHPPSLIGFMTRRYVFVLTPNSRRRGAGNI
jgi:hypothetical protein